MEETERDCEFCAGTGFCPECNGEADGIKRTCVFCDDTGYCVKCGGAGFVVEF